MSNTRILTAAHCVLEEKAALKGHLDVTRTVVVRVGNWNSNDVWEAGEFMVVAKKVTVHPKYAFFNDQLTPGYDFAIVEVPDLSTVSK